MNRTQGKSDYLFVENWLRTYGNDTSISNDTLITCCDYQEYEGSYQFSYCDTMLKVIIFSDKLTVGSNANISSDLVINETETNVTVVSPPPIE